MPLPHFGNPYSRTKRFVSLKRIKRSIQNRNQKARIHSSKAAPIGLTSIGIGILTGMNIYRAVGPTGSVGPVGNPGLPGYSRLYRLRQIKSLINNLIK